MNYKAFKYLYIAGLMMFSLISCSKDGEYDLSETPPLDFRSYYDGLTVTFANATESASDISWDFGDQTAVVTGDSVAHTYTQTGNYVISMNGTVDGKSYTFHTIVRVDKPSLVDLGDESFADWDNVTYPDFQLSGKGSIDTAKVDYDANYIYVYVEFNANEGAGLEDHIFGVYIDSDNAVSSGFSMKEMGVDYGVEGNLYDGGWFGPSYVDLANGDPGWPFMGFDDENAIKPGYLTQEGDIVKMEFGILRESFKINSDVFSFSMSIMNSDWSDVGNLVNADYNERITVTMDKQ